jgi:hypothetical protein
MDEFPHVGPRLVIPAHARIQVVYCPIGLDTLWSLPLLPNAVV